MMQELRDCRIQMSIRCEDEKENMQGEGKIQGEQNKTGREDENKQRGIQVEGNTDRGVNTCRGRSRKRTKCDIKI